MFDAIHPLRQKTLSHFLLGAGYLDSQFYCNVQANHRCDAFMNSKLIFSFQPFAEQARLHWLLALSSLCWRVAARRPLPIARYAAPSLCWLLTCRARVVNQDVKSFYDWWGAKQV